MHAPKQEIGDDLFWEGRDVRNKLGEFDLGSEWKLCCAFIIQPEGGIIMPQMMNVQGYDC